MNPDLRGQLTEKNYTFYWKGKDENEPRMHGVGFAVSNSFVTQLTELPVGISERLIIDAPSQTCRLSASNHDQSVALDATDEDKEKFYAQLDTILTAITASDSLPPWRL